MQEKQREEKIKRWFDMWLTGERQELSRLFDKNVYYSESWGPEYHGAKKKNTGLMNGISVELFLYGTLSNLFIQMSKRL